MFVSFRFVSNLISIEKSVDNDCNINFPVDSHLLLDCEFAKQTLFSFMLSYRIPVDLDFNDWLLSILSCGDLFSTQLLCTLVNKLWLARNLRLYQFKESSLVRVAEEALASVFEFNKWHTIGGVVSGKAPQKEKSNRGVHTLQVDGSTFEGGIMTRGCSNATKFWSSPLFVGR